MRGLQYHTHIVKEQKMVQNKAFIYKRCPEGWPVPGQDLTIESTPFDADAAPPRNGFTTANLYATFDPSQRARMRDSSIKSYNEPMEEGKPVVAVHVIGQVLKSDNDKFQADDLVMFTLWPTEEYSSVEETTATTLRPFKSVPGVPLTAWLGALGMTGLTAYGSLLEIGQPKQGETILVSAAAGAVGQIVGQTAHLLGLKVIGSVGGQKKLDFITNELGFTSGFDYRKENPSDALRRLAPEGLDIFYDNVGGELLEAALEHMKPWGRIVACGAVSQYNLSKEQQYGIKNYPLLFRKRIRWQGFVVIDENIRQHAGERDRKCIEWIAKGDLKSVDYVTEGMDKAIDGFLGMLKGDNIGKSILHIADPKSA